MTGGVGVPEGDKVACRIAATWGKLKQIKTPIWRSG